MSVISMSICNALIYGCILGKQAGKKDFAIIIFKSTIEESAILRYCAADNLIFLPKIN